MFGNEIVSPKDDSRPNDGILEIMVSNETADFRTKLIFVDNPWFENPEGEVIFIGPEGREKRYKNMEALVDRFAEIGLSIRAANESRYGAWDYLDMLGVWAFQYEVDRRSASLFGWK